MPQIREMTLSNLTGYKLLGFGFGVAVAGNHDARLVL